MLLDTLTVFEDDDLGTEAEINDLDQIFRDLYNYKTQRYLIPSHNSANRLENALINFRRSHDHEDNLLILYYGGHGTLEPYHDWPIRSIWNAKQGGGASLVWSDLQGVLQRAAADVVFVLDCCFAAPDSRGGAGAKEGLWACNSQVTTMTVNNNSFTRNLIEELKSLHDTGYNIAMLHARLMKRYHKVKLIVYP